MHVCGFLFYIILQHTKNYHDYKSINVQQYVEHFSRTVIESHFKAFDRKLGPSLNIKL